MSASPPAGGPAVTEPTTALRSASLRYFNAAGADPLGRAGEDHNPETHLIPRAILATLGKLPPLHVFGTDYDTPDGTRRLSSSTKYCPSAPRIKSEPQM